jgi:hypothetical protein
MNWKTNIMILTLDLMIKNNIQGFLRLLLVEAFESVEDLFSFTSAILVDLIGVQTSELLR